MFRLTKITAMLTAAFLLSAGIAYATPQFEGGAAGGIIGGIAGALLDHKNHWRGGVIGAGLGAITGATLTDISVRGSREAVQAGGPVEYRPADGQDIYRVEPVGTAYYPDEYTMPAPPSVVLIPGTYVYAVPDSELSLLYYDGYWWRPVRGQWYRSGYCNGPWHYVRPGNIPYAIVELPPDYPRMLHGRHQIAYGQVRDNWGRWKKERMEERREGRGEWWKERGEHRGANWRFEDD